MAMSVDKIEDGGGVIKATKGVLYTAPIINDAQHPCFEPCLKTNEILLRAFRQLPSLQQHQSIL